MSYPGAAPEVQAHLYKSKYQPDPGFLGDFIAFQDMGQYNAQLHE